MTKAIRVHAHGGPEVLRLDEVALPDPGPGEARVRHRAIGLNYIDTYHRTGLYPIAPPHGLGMEAAGEVVAVGEGVDLAVGARVAYGLGPPGAYAEERVMEARFLVPVPDDVTDEAAAAALLKGMTVEFLVRRVYTVQPGDTVLWHAAAGGVGLLAMGWLKALGATVIGTVSSDEKAELARAHGCDHAIVYTREDFVARVLEITSGAKLPVVYDSVGAATFDRSLQCLRPRGLAVAFGNASGAPAPIDLGLLARLGSLYVTRPSLMTYCAAREDLLASAAEVFRRVASGDLGVEVGQRFALADAAEAHRALEARGTVGSTLLLP